MTVTLNNRARLDRPVGNQQYYEWEVFIDEPDPVLDKIDYVVYFLHPTFPNSVRTITDRESHFALRTKGWGEFKINIRVVYKDEEVEQVQYDLDLSKS